MTGFTDEHLNAMAEAAAEFTKLAHEHNAGAMIFSPYDGPPPAANFFLEIMREMVDETGDAMGSICVGIEGESGFLPLIDVHPVEALHAIVHARLNGAIPKVNWVTVACDTYVLRSVGEMQDAHSGDAAAAFAAGNPNATEALMAMCTAPDGPGYDVHQCYTRLPDGIDWEEPVNMSTVASEGDLPTLMRELVLA